MVVAETAGSAGYIVTRPRPRLGLVLDPRGVVLHGIAPGMAEAFRVSTEQVPHAYNSSRRRPNGLIPSTSLSYVINHLAEVGRGRRERPT